MSDSIRSPEVQAPLLTSLDRGVLTVTLNRPQQRNALSLDMLDALGEALETAAADDRVRVVVLTGAGRAFCAGGDIKTLARGESIFGPMQDRAGRVARQAKAQRETSVRLWRFPKTTIALINGHAVGAGLALSLACDLRYVARSAELRPAFSTIGLAGDFGATWLLAQLVGRARAHEMLLFAEPISAELAQQRGLVTDVFDDDQLMADGLQRAHTLAARSMPALAAIKRNLEVAEHADLETAADAEAARHVELLDTDEHRTALGRLLALRSDRPSTGAEPPIQGELHD